MQLVSSPNRSRSVFTKYGKHATRVAQELASALCLFRAGVRDGLDLFGRHEALSRLSDEALGKRGLARGDIARAVLDERKTSK